MKLSMMSYTLARVGRSEDFDIARMCRLTRELELSGIDMVTTYGRDPRELRRIVDDHGLKIICYTFMSDLIFPDRAGRKPGVEAIRKAMETAVILGADRAMIPTPGKEGIPRETARRQIIQGLQESIEFARQAKVILTVENFPGANSPFVVAADVLQAIREVPGLKLTFDNGNVLTGGEDPAESFRQCAGHVVHSHFKDWDLLPAGQGMKGLDGRYYQGALIGEGIVDQRSCLRAMKASGYEGFINIEYEGSKYSPEEATRKAVAYLRPILAELKR